MLVEADETGQTLREYVWLDDMPLAVVSDANTMSPNLYFVHADHLDTPVRMTHGSKAVVWDAYFLPFGSVFGKKKRGLLKPVGPVPIPPPLGGGQRRVGDGGRPIES